MSSWLLVLIRCMAQEDPHCWAWAVGHMGQAGALDVLRAAEADLCGGRRALVCARTCARMHMRMATLYTPWPRLRQLHACQRTCSVLR